MGSNPTPRAYLGDLYDNFKSKRGAKYDETTNLALDLILPYESIQKEKEQSLINKINSLLPDMGLNIAPL